MATPKFNRYPFKSLRFWHGMAMGPWIRLLARNGFRIHPFRLYTAAWVTFCATFNSMLGGWQRAAHGRRIRNTQVEQPPIFIIGHWRSGTTYLHELLARDDRLAFPTGYECFAPAHFLVSERIMPRLLGWLVPPTRPMDNMAWGLAHPQEDEFALCMLGAPTPYQRMAFPNNPAPYEEMLDLENVCPADLERFKEALMSFVQALTLRSGKRLVLKSPAHTGRIQLLSQMFPGARFIHMVRHPHALFPSTRRLWQALDTTQGLQLPHDRGLNEYVFRCFERMQRGFERQRPLIEPSHLCDLRYEDLVRDPIGHVRELYEKLDLGEFEPVRGELQAHVEGQKDYQPNQHQLDKPLMEEIRRRWGDYFERYGYEVEGRDGAGP